MIWIYAFSIMAEKMMEFIAARYDANEFLPQKPMCRLNLAIHFDSTVSPVIDAAPPLPATVWTRPNFYYGFFPGAVFVHFAHLFNDTSLIALKVNNC